MVKDDVYGMELFSKVILQSKIISLKGGIKK